MFIVGVFIALVLCLVLMVAKLFASKTIFEKILISNSFGTLIVALIVLIGVHIKTEFYIDIAIIYALINFITVIAFLRYFQNTGEH